MTFTIQAIDCGFHDERRNGERERAELVRSFNDAVGIMNAEIAHMQTTFIAGLMTAQESASYERYCRYMIATINEI